MKAEKWNEKWKFWPEKNAFALVWSIPAGAREVTLPHDAMIEAPAREDSPNRSNTGYRDGGNYTYVKNLFVPQEDKDKRYVLKFEGIYAHSMVFVNEQYAGGCANGYSAFYVDLTNFLRVGADNEIRVQAKNAGMTNSRWYTGSGIYRDVYLLKSGSVYIAPDGVRVTTETADAELAVLRVETEVVNAKYTPQKVTLRTCIGDLEESSLLFLRGGETRTVSQRIALPTPQLWSSETPSLYTVESAVLEGETVLDENEEIFGIRTITMDASRGFQVNGATVKLRGACIHHDSGVLGAATYEDAHKRQIALLKQAGFNAIRMSHHTAAPALLRACDTLGMYVMDELTDMWNRGKSDLDYAMDFEKNWVDDLTRMVRKDYNHPSVVFYSIGNEIPEIGGTGGSALCADISAKAHELDSTRFTTAGLNGVFMVGDRVAEILSDLSAGQEKARSPEGNVNEFLAALTAREDDLVSHPIVTERLDYACAGLDLAGYNYMVARYSSDAKNYPNRVMVGSETYPSQIARIWTLVEQIPALIGDFTWTGWDYIGEAGVAVQGYGAGGAGGFGSAFPCQLAYTGDLDITGFRRPASYYREIVYGLRSKPYIAVQDPAHYGEFRRPNPWILTDAVAGWDWPGYEGKNVSVEVYAPCGEVELQLNGRPVGRKIVESCKAVFEIVYEPGILCAVNFEDERELGSFSLQTPGTSRKLILEKEYFGDELIYIGVTVADETGLPVTGAEEQLTASVSGGTLLGFGSGSHSPKYNYGEGRTETWHGRALLVVKRGDESVRITVRSASGHSVEYNEQETR